MWQDNVKIIKALGALMILFMILLVIVSVNDLNISEAIYSPDTGFGVFIQYYTYVPTYLMMMIFLSIIHRFLCITSETFLFLWHGMYGLGILTLLFIFIEKSLEYYSSVFVILVLFLIFFRLGLFIASRIKKEYLYQMSELSLSALVAYGMMFVSVYLLKIIIGRVRPYMVYSGSEDFMPWHQINGFVINSDFQSVPSGHTGFAFLMVFIVFIPKILNQKHLTTPFFIGSILWTLVVAYGRVLHGAHFITDTVLTLIMSIIILLGSIKGVTFGFKKIIKRMDLSGKTYH